MTTHDLTTYQAAEFLTERLSTPDGAPSITSAKIRSLLDAELLNDVGGSRTVRISGAQLETLASTTRYVADPAEIDDLVLRVSVLRRRPNPVIKRGTHTLLRSEAGVLYSDPNQSSALALGGFEGVWNVSRDNAARLVDEHGTLLATCKGYVHPEHVRAVDSWDRIEGSGRRYFHTSPVSARIAKVIGTGIWIDVPPGRESGILVG